FGLYGSGVAIYLGMMCFSGGNSASLESLGVLLHQSDVDMPPNYNVFTPTSHPKLT
ncbi:hypothetical protein GGI19_005972, partial [Coemansia pectinata]